MKRWSWLLWLALVVVSVLQIARTEVVTDVTSFLPGAANADQRLLADQLRNGLSTRIMLLGLRLEERADGGKPGAAQTRALTQASQALRAKLATQPEFAWVSNGDFGAHKAERERVFAARYLLGPPATGATPSPRFTAPELRDAFARLEQELISARGGLIKSIAPADPTLDALALLEKASGVMAPMAGDGIWMTADARSAIVLFETTARGYEIAELRETMAVASRSAAEVLQAWPAGLSRPVVDFAGAGYFIVKSHDAIGKDAERLSLLATALVACLLLWALRSPRFLGLAAIPVATGALAGFAAVGWFSGSIHGITLAFGVTLIGEAVDYAIYAFVQRDPAGRHAPRFWRQLMLAMATSLIGFAAMFFSGFQGLKQLGVFSIVGLIVAAACTRWLLPPLLPRIDRDGRGYRGIRWQHFSWLPAFARRMGTLRIPLVLVAAVALVLLVQRHAGMWQDNLDSLSSSSAVESARDLRYRQDIGVPDLRSMLVVRGASVDQALERTEATARMLDRLVGAGRLAGYDSPTALLPSSALQKSRQAALPQAEALREQVSEALAGGNLRAQAFLPFVAAVSAAKERAPIDRTYYDGTIIGRWLDAQIVSADGGAAVLILLRGVTAQTQLGQALKEAGLPGATMLDLKGDVETLVAGYREQTMRVTLIGGCGILLLLALRLRERRAVISMASALVVSVIVTAWIVLMVEGSLTIFNLVALLLVVGVASNYTLFFSTLSAVPEERQRASLSVLLAAASTFSAFAMLAWSSSPVLALIGKTVAIGAAVGLVASMVFAPRMSGR